MIITFLIAIVLGFVGFYWMSTMLIDFMEKYSYDQREREND